MPTEYNIKKIQLPNGSICNLPDDVKYIDITKSGESYSLPTGVTYTTIKSIIDNGELCVLKVPFSGTDESGYKYFYPVKDYTYEVESTDYYDLKFVSSADPNETGIEVLTITSLNSVSIDNFPLGVSQSEVNTIIENKTVGVAYGESTTAAATAQKEVTVADISELNVGQIIIVKPTITSTVANSTLKVNDFPAYSMLYNGSAISTSTDSIVWAANVPSMFVLDEVSGTKYWRFAGHGLDSNSTYILNKLIDAGQYTAGTGTYAVTRYSILAEKPNGTWEKITSTSSGYSTATTKTVNTSGFVLNQLRYYNTTTNRGTGTLITTNTIEKQSASVNYAYSFNCSTAPGWEIGDYIYLVGTLGVDGLFYLDTTQWWSTSLPTTEDGKLYIQLGLALTTTDATGSFLMERPIYYYKGGAVRLWSNVSGVNDGTNWTSLTIDGVTKNLPSGGTATVGTLNTNNSSTQSASSSESFSGTINLHKVSKTGKLEDMVDVAFESTGTPDGSVLLWDNTNKYWVSDLLAIPTADSELTNDRYVRYDTASQGLNTTQQANARTNIGAGTSNFSGSYNDLSDKPTIPTVPTFSTLTLSGTAQAYDGTHTLKVQDGTSSQKGIVQLGTGSSNAAAGNHAHGNITNGGDITATGVAIANGDALVIRDNSASKLAKTSITFDGSTTNQFLSKKGTWQTAGLSITVVKDLMSYDDYLTATSSYDWSYSSFYLWKCSGYGGGPDSSSYMFEEAYYVVGNSGDTPKLMHLDNEEISGESGMAINWSWTETRNIQDKEIIYVQNSGVYYIYNADEYKLIPLNKNTANYDLIYDGNRIIDAECIDWPLIYGNSYDYINESFPSSITLNIGSYMSMGYGTISNDSTNTIHTLILCNTNQSDCAITVSPTPNVSSGLTNSSFTIPGNGIAELSVAVYTNGVGTAEYSLIVKTDFD